MMMMKKRQLVSIDHVNKLTCNRWCECFADIVEKSPEIAQKVWKPEPYANFVELEKAFYDALDNLNTRDKIKIINRHKDVVQAIFHRFLTFKADINSGSVIKFLDINHFEAQLCNGIYLLKAYEKSFGFPFIMKPTEINFEEFYLALQYRCNNTGEQEFRIAMDEIKKYSSEKLRCIVYAPKEFNVFKQ